MLGLLRNRCLSLFSKPTNTTYRFINNNLSSTVNRRYVFSFLQLSHLGDYFTSKHLYRYQYDDEKEIEGPPEMKKKITKGDVIDLHDLLFTKNRDYLVRYQDNQQVKAEHLTSKVIVIYFTPLDGTHNMSYYVPLLENLYINLYPHNDFEVVFIAFNDDVDHDPVHYRDYCKCIEEKIFSLRPWIAIPLSDVPSENSLQRRGFPEISRGIPTVLIVDSTGMVLQCHDAYYILELYGALGYPFTDERINNLQSEDDAIAMQPSLQNLLASSLHDYVISNKGDKAIVASTVYCNCSRYLRRKATVAVILGERLKELEIPIHTLEDKVVALYFYQDGDTDDTQLKWVYNELKNNNENFEVVLIYSPDDCEFYCKTEESFWKRFKTMPWLALPFNNPNDTKLKRILEYSLKFMNFYDDPDQVTRLVIIGPHCEFIEPFGANILKEFGTRAYPFTFAKLVKVEIEKINDLKLEMLWDHNKVFRGKDGSEVHASQLVGKNVILFLESYSFNSRTIEFLKILKERYVQCKGTCDEFEVVHILQKEDEVVSKQIGYLPWLVCDEFSPMVDWKFFYVHNNTKDSFVFFDGDGNVVRKTIWPSFENVDFPFCADGLEKEAWVQLGIWFDWKSWYGSCVPFSGRSRIYSLEKMNAPTSLSVRFSKKKKFECS